jgi:hypothetical protein
VGKSKTIYKKKRRKKNKEASRHNPPRSTAHKRAALECSALHRRFLFSRSKPSRLASPVVAAAVQNTALLARRQLFEVDTRDILTTASSKSDPSGMLAS